MDTSTNSELALLSVGQNLTKFERLKTAVRDYDYSIEVSSAKNIVDAIDKLTNKQYSVIVLAPDFSEQEMRDFIAQIPETTGGKDSAVVLVVSAKDNLEMEEKMSIGLLIGANGFLQEPFSVTGVKETLALAASVKTDRLQKRQKNGIQLSLMPAKKLIDKTATMLRVYPDHKTSLKEIKRMSESIQKCEEENSDLYFRVLIGSFIRLCKTEQKITPDNYAGKSKRVSKMVAAKLSDEAKCLEEEEMIDGS